MVKVTWPYNRPIILFTKYNFIFYSSLRLNVTCDSRQMLVYFGCYIYKTVKTAHCGLQRLSQYSSHIYNSHITIFTFAKHAIPPFDKHYQISPSSSSMAMQFNRHFAILVSICLSRPPTLALAPGPGPVLLPSICIYRPRLSICFYQPWHSVCVCLFFDLQLKFVILTVSTYICTTKYIRLCTCFLG